MTVSIDRRGAGALLLLLTLVCVFVAPRGLVLCVGEDGHVAIESAVEIAPCGVPLAEWSSAAGVRLTETCTDTLLAPQLPIPSSERHTSAPIVATLSSAPRLTSVRTPLRTLARSDAPSRHLRVLRTVVQQV